MTVTIDGKELEDLDALVFRFNLCRTCIKAVSETPADDPRRADALAEYNRQLQEISEKIKAITGKYPPIGVSLETAKLTGNSRLGG